MILKISLRSRYKALDPNTAKNPDPHAPGLKPPADNVLMPGNIYTYYTTKFLHTKLSSFLYPHGLNYMTQKNMKQRTG